MKVTNLIEMPMFIDREMRTKDSGLAKMHLANLKKNYKIVQHDSDGSFVAIAKDKTKAIAGTIDGNDVIRHIEGTLEVPPPIEGLSNAVVMKYVEAAAATKGSGFGQLLYKGLASAGYPVVSDDLQMRGGRAIWTKLANTLPNDLVVNLADSRTGKLVRDDKGGVVNYNGTNYNSDIIWGNTDDHDAIRLILRKK